MKRLGIVFWSVLALSCLMLRPAVGAAQAASPAPTARSSPPLPAPSVSPVEAGSGVVRATLSNGMTVILLPNNLAPVATTIVMYGVGSDDDTVPGVAHATEHMLFRGTTDVSAGQLSDIAARMGAQYDAQTSNEFTLYWFKLPSAYVDVALHIEADRMTRAAIRASDWATERGAIEQEIRAQESQPGFAISSKLRSVFFSGTPFGNVVGGTVPSFEKLTSDDIRAFYQKWYHPSNATLIVSGDIDPQKTLGQIHGLFDAIPAGPPPARPQIQIPPLANTTIRETMDFPVGFGALAYRVPGATDPDYAASLVLNEAFNSGRGALEDLGAVHKVLGAFSFSNAYPETGVNFLVAVPVAGDTPESALALVSGVVDDYRRNGVPQELIDAAKTRLLAERAYSQASISGLGFAWAEADSHHQTSPDEIYKAIAQVGSGDLSRVLNEYFSTDHQVSLIISAKPTSVLSKPDPNAGVENVAYTPTKDEPLPEWAASALSASLHAPASDANIVTRRLPNGLWLDIRHESAAPAVIVSGVIRNDPQLYDPPGKDGVSMLVSGILPWGTATYDRKAYQAQLDSVAATISLGTTFSMSVPSKDFDRGMELLADGLLHPAFAPDAFTTVKADWLQSVIVDNALPSEKADLATRLALYPPGDPRRRDVTARTISSITLDDVKRYYRFAYRPDLTKIAVVGDVTPQQAQAVAQKYFGGWKATGPKPTFQYPVIRSKAPKASSVTVTSSTNTQSQVTLRQVLHLRGTDNDYVPLLLANTILSGEGTGSLLFQNLRTRDGYVYSVDSDLNLNSNGAEFSISFASEPKNVNNAESAALSIIKQMQHKPLPMVELQRAKASLLAKKVLPLDSYSGVADDMLAGAGGGYFANLIDRLFWQELLQTTPDQLEHAMRRIDSAHFVRVIVAPGP